MSITPEQKRIYNQKYRETHREEIRAQRLSVRERTQAYGLAYREAHREERLAYKKQYYKDRAEEIRTKKRIYDQAHLEEIRAKARAFAAAHTEEHKKYHAEWRKKNPHQRAVQERRRRARKANAAVNDFTHTQWVMLQAVFKYRCAYCGKRCKGKLTMDHVTPLSKGGNHTLQNIVPACKSCNSKKHDGPPLAPVSTLLV